MSDYSTYDYAKEVAAAWRVVGRVALFVLGVAVITLARLKWSDDPSATWNVVCFLAGAGLILGGLLGFAATDDGYRRLWTQSSRS